MRPTTIGLGGRSLPIGVRALAAAIRAYQIARVGRVSPCRFTPTCSQYALEAIESHGARRGLSLTARRLARCRPGGPGGYDPVPEGPPRNPCEGHGGATTSVDQDHRRPRGGGPSRRPRSQAGPATVPERES